MTSPDDAMFEQVGGLLESRPGWHLEPSTTPGAAPSWCLVADGEILLSVGVDRGRVVVFVPAEDAEHVLGGLNALIPWLERNAGRDLRP